MQSRGVACTGSLMRAERAGYPHVENRQRGDCHHQSHPVLEMNAEQRKFADQPLGSLLSHRSPASADLPGRPGHMNCEIGPRRARSASLGTSRALRVPFRARAAHIVRFRAVFVRRPSFCRAPQFGEGTGEARRRVCKLSAHGKLLSAANLIRRDEKTFAVLPAIFQLSA